MSINWTFDFKERRFFFDKMGDNVAEKIQKKMPEKIKANTLLANTSTSSRSSNLLAEIVFQAIRCCNMSRKLESN
jgi:hypothetical protein